jgi:formylglycine-generating enzyme required for sulfatase activity
VVFAGDLFTSVDSAIDPELDRIASLLGELDGKKFRNRTEESAFQSLAAQHSRLKNMNVEHWCELLRPSFETYALCSDAQKGDPEQLTFMMGASAADTTADKERETPWHKVIVPAFYMATACVTRAQYALFDPQREREHSNLPSKAPEPDCPMIYVNFHDGICFALWLDDSYSLPSEVQWEGAAWGGLDREQYPKYVIGVPPYTANFTSAEVNFDGNHPLQGPKSEYRERTVPVRFSEFQPNGFGLWQMSGNVWEYTRSEWHKSLQDAIEHEKGDLFSGSAEASRCVRGGSWYNYARYTRCSYRLCIDYRYFITGIRLSRTK